MTVSRARAFDILTTDLARSFEPRVTKVLPGATQNVFDGAASFDFNTGRVHNASWVAALKAGNPAKAEASFRSWNKGGGRLLKGLVRRRGREADIIFRNRYGAGIPAPTGSATEWTEEIVACQTALARLGFYTGEIDGRAGPKTVAAVKAFQIPLI
jgi:lysozyme